MEIRPLRADEVDRLIEELWLPFASEMAELDAYNALADDVLDAARAYRRSNLADSDTATFVATALLDRAESWAASRDCEYTALSVTERNETAQAVYESRGYAVRRYEMDNRLAERGD